MSGRNGLDCDEYIRDNCWDSDSVSEFWRKRSEGMKAQDGALRFGSCGGKGWAQRTTFRPHAEGEKTAMASVRVPNVSVEGSERALSISSIGSVLDQDTVAYRTIYEERDKWR